MPDVTGVQPGAAGGVEPALGEKPNATRIVLASSFPERLNRNLAILFDLADAFRTIAGTENVFLLDYAGVDQHVRRLRPSLVLLVGSAMPVQADYRELATACRASGALFAFWTVEDPYEFDSRSKYSAIADLIFSNDAWAAQFYDHPRVHHLPLAASPKKVRALDHYHSRPIDVFFCGVGFKNRQVVVADALPVLEQYRSVILGENWPADPSGVVVNRRIPEADMSGYYASALCVLNLGRDFDHANRERSLVAVTPGPRTFEAAMVGTVQLVWQPSAFMDDYLQRGTEYVACYDVDQLAQAIARLLADGDAAREIARAAQRRALAEHTYENRARSILAASGLG